MYYETIDKLEKMSIDQEYIQGWVGGFLGNPLREEQRTNPAYDAGYADGVAKTTDQAESFGISSRLV